MKMKIMWVVIIIVFVLMLNLAFAQGSKEVFLDFDNPQVKLIEITHHLGHDKSIIYQPENYEFWWFITFGYPDGEVEVRSQYRVNIIGDISDIPFGVTGISFYTRFISDYWCNNPNEDVTKWIKEKGTTEYGCFHQYRLIEENGKQKIRAIPWEPLKEYLASWEVEPCKRPKIFLTDKQRKRVYQYIDYLYSLSLDRAELSETAHNNLRYGIRLIRALWEKSAAEIAYSSLKAFPGDSCNCHVARDFIREWLVSGDDGSLANQMLKDIKDMKKKKADFSKTGFCELLPFANDVKGYYSSKFLEGNNKLHQEIVKELKEICGVRPLMGVPPKGHMICPVIN